MTNLPKIFANEILQHNPNRFSNKIEIDPPFNLAFSQDNGLFINKVHDVLPYISPYEFIDGELDPEINYHVNSYGHRCDEFTDNHDGEHILFSGCSNTTGMAMPFEANWARMLYSDISKQSKTSGFYRLSFCSGGYQKIISNIFKYCNQFGNPDTIFLLLPNTSREIVFLNYSEVKKEDLNNINLMHCVEIGYPYPWEEKEIKDKENYSFTNIEHHKQMFLYSFMLLQMLQQYCLSNNIKLYVSSWDKYQTVLLNSISSIKFLNIYDNNYDKYLYDNKDRKDKYLFYARDSKHLGVLDSEYISKKFFMEYQDETN